MAVQQDGGAHGGRSSGGKCVRYCRAVASRGAFLRPQRGTGRRVAPFLLLYRAPRTSFSSPPLPAAAVQRVLRRQAALPAERWWDVAAGGGFGEEPGLPVPVCLRAGTLGASLCCAGAAAGPVLVPLLPSAVRHT